MQHRAEVRPLAPLGGYAALFRQGGLARGDSLEPNGDDSIIAADAQGVWRFGRNGSVIWHKLLSFAVSQYRTSERHEYRPA